MPGKENVMQIVIHNKRVQVEQNKVNRFLLRIWNIKNCDRKHCLNAVSLGIPYILTHVSPISFLKSVRTHTNKHSTKPYGIYHWPSAFCFCHFISRIRLLCLHKNTYACDYESQHTTSSMCLWQRTSDTSSVKYCIAIYSLLALNVRRELNLVPIEKVNKQTNI